MMFHIINVDHNAIASGVSATLILETFSTYGRDGYKGEPKGGFRNGLLSIVEIIFEGTAD